MATPALSNEISFALGTTTILRTLISPWYYDENRAVHRRSCDKIDSAQGLVLDETGQAFLRQLEEIEHLPANWDGDGGLPVNKTIMLAARRMASVLGARDLCAEFSAPRIVPLPDGRLHFEWWRDRDYFAIAFLSGTEVLCLSKRRSSFTRERFSVSDSQNICSRLSGFVNPLSGSYGSEG
jgi:hypothetical protein